MKDRIVRLVSLPSQIRAMTSEDSNGDYNIYINGNLALEAQQKAYEHELKHIDNGDYEKVVDINTSECRIHKEDKCYLNQ